MLAAASQTQPPQRRDIPRVVPILLEGRLENISLPAQLRMPEYPPERLLAQRALADIFVPVHA